MTLVAGIVLAAGRSSRMGHPKLLLEIDGETFLGRAVRTLREGGCDPVVAVISPGADAHAIEVVENAGGRIAVNSMPEAEQIDSLRVGLHEVGEAEAAIVLPVDFPLAVPATVRALRMAWLARRAPIVRPTHEGRPGHPVLFGRAIWTELGAPDLEHGARDVVHRHAAQIVEVPVDDQGVTVDVNTPEDYTRATGR
jgi:molybdenum cofactor cytidylyltransferase